MKIISILFLLSFTFQQNVAAKTKVEGKLTWAKLTKLEKEMSAWSKKATEEGMITMGKMNQRPSEIEIIRAYFPYLLPKKFFSYNMDMSCYPEFSEHKKQQAQKSYDAWQKCLRILYRKSMLKLLKKALKDLRP